MRFFVSLCSLTLLLFPAPADAASYSSLKKKGFKTGKLTRSKGGSWGWFATNGSTRYFCTMRASIVLINTRKYISYTTAGRQIPGNRVTFEKIWGRSMEGKFPYLRDLKNGKLRKQDVGPCTKQR